ncbi:hypothetical protein AB0M29_42425 [Streptomyces sp. NPDC051976]|uniref:hypothetical protein n=1 Tax=Streptomyces sp. NPDC051976 TaxID=3154947 RepID=UPI00342CD403
MTSINQLLSRALLLKESDVPADVVPYDDAYATTGWDDGTLWPDVPRDSIGDTAAVDLQTLCETVVMQGAATALGDFVTQQLPAPDGARVLGCVLQLTDADDGARFWWQYAAGAGDDAASYCLYLHHLALGEADAAAWWRKQTRIDTQPAPETVALPYDEDDGQDLALDSSTPTVLRVLSNLLGRTSRQRTELVDAVMDYVPGAVAAGYIGNPDTEIPLPGPDFADHIAVILAAASSFEDTRSAHDQQGPSPRPLRRRQPSAAGADDHARGTCQPGQAVRGGHR